ncbi:MAG: hypothetical protein K6A38_04145 [Lachnospiraceae bacterium]|nr:hypothetical protein [Lachnospiraceae bacterium]
MKDIKMGIFLVLEKDGTGLLDVYVQKYDLTYDKKTANIEVEGDEFEVPLKWKKNQYVLEDFMDSTMKFERANKSEKKEYKNGEWNESFELDGPGTEDVDNGDYNWSSLDNMKGDLDDVEAADAMYSDQDYCTEGVITEICTDEGLEGVKIALSKKRCG